MDVETSGDYQLKLINPKEIYYRIMSCVSYYVVCIVLCRVYRIMSCKNIKYIFFFKFKTKYKKEIGCLYFTLKIKKIEILF